MSKIIIENRSDLDMETVLLLVNRVIKSGRISNYGKQYCYGTSFGIGNADYMVATDLNKNSDRFTIYKQPTKEQNERAD